MTDAPLGRHAVDDVARVGARHSVRRMNHAPKRLSKRRLGHAQTAGETHGITCRYRDEFRKATWQPGNAVLRIKRALVRIPGQAIFATRLAVSAGAIQSLIDDDAVAR